MLSSGVHSMLTLIQRFALRAQLLNPPLPQLFPERLDFQMRPV